MKTVNITKVYCSQEELPRVIEDYTERGYFVKSVFVEKYEERKTTDQFIPETYELSFEVKQGYSKFKEYRDSIDSEF